MTTDNCSITFIRMIQNTKAKPFYVKISIIAELILSRFILLSVTLLFIEQLQMSLLKGKMVIKQINKFF